LNHVIAIQEPEEQLYYLVEGGPEYVTVPEVKLNLEDSIEVAPGWEDWVLRNDFGENTLMVFSDGSVLEDGRASYYRTLVRDVANVPEEMMWGGGLVPTPFGEPQSSYRAESMGLVSALFGYEPMLKSARVVLITDSQSVKDHWDGLEYMTDSQRLAEKDKDIWEWVRLGRETWGKRFSVEWTKSHQDKIKRQEDLTFWDRGNILADKGTAKMYEHGKQDACLEGGNSWELWDSNQRVTGPILRHLKRKTQLLHSEHYMSGYSARFEGVDLWKHTEWDALNKISKGWYSCKQVQMVKLCWGLTATASLLAKNPMKK
jgi:ribonuclease HI